MSVTLITFLCGVAITVQSVDPLSRPQLPFSSKGKAQQWLSEFVKTYNEWAACSEDVEECEYGHAMQNVIAYDENGESTSIYRIDDVDFKYSEKYMKFFKDHLSGDASAGDKPFKLTGCHVEEYGEDWIRGEGVLHLKYAAFPEFNTIKMDDYIKFNDDGTIDLTIKSTGGKITRIVAWEELKLSAIGYIAPDFILKEIAKNPQKFVMKMIFAAMIIMITLIATCCFAMFRKNKNGYLKKKYQYVPVIMDDQISTAEDA